MAVYPSVLLFVSLFFVHTQDGTVAGDSGSNVASRANSDRFMGFGELLRQAEQAQAQASRGPSL